VGNLHVPEELGKLWGCLQLPTRPNSGVDGKKPKCRCRIDANPKGGSSGGRLVTTGINDEGSNRCAANRTENDIALMKRTASDRIAIQLVMELDPIGIMVASGLALSFPLMKAHHVMMLQQRRGSPTRLVDAPWRR
jgi:hypothetical protein